MKVNDTFRKVSEELEVADKTVACEKLVNENDESKKKPAWPASEYIVSKSGTGGTRGGGPKKMELQIIYWA